MKIGNMEVYGIIYKIKNKLNNKVYIGQTIRPFCLRYSGGNIYNTGNKHLKSSIEKYGVENFEIVEVYDVAFSKQELDIKECIYIDLFNSMNPKFGYNKKHGGANGRPNEETRRKLSESHKGIHAGEKNPNYGKPSPRRGKCHTEEAKKKMSEANKGENHPNYGKELPQSTRDNISKAKMGHTVDEETRSKISETLKGRYKGKDNPTSTPIVCLETGEEFDCQREACAKYGINPANMSAHLKGRKKSVNKLHFKFITNND